MSDDAVKVHCDMEGPGGGGETCVFPDVHASKMPNIPWRRSGDGWYSSLRGGFKVRNINDRVFIIMFSVLIFKCVFTDQIIILHLQITYDSVGPVQMSFLRLLSHEAHQNVTYTCINSAAW